MKRIIASTLMFFLFGIGLYISPAQAAIGGDDKRVIVTLARAPENARIPVVTRSFQDSPNNVWVCEENDSSCRFEKVGSRYRLTISKNESVSNATYTYSGNGITIKGEWDGSPLPVNFMFRTPSGEEVKLTLVFARALVSSL